MITIVVLALVLVFVLVLKADEKQVRNTEFWKTLRNFPIEYRGRVVWHHRAVSTTLFVFCKNKEGELCALVNKRGRGTPDFRGKWNVPSGYLEFYLTGEANCAKELYEECGLRVNEKNIKLVSISTSPNQNKQNVSLRYMIELGGVTDDYKLSTANMEKDEVEDIMWVTSKDLANYEWAFDHYELLKEMFENFLN